MVKGKILLQEKELLMKTSARQVALETLIKVLKNGSYSNISLNNALKNAHLSITDQNLATKLVYGTIQYQLYLEYQLKDLIKTKLKEPYLKPLLLMSAYQILFLNKIPNRAVLDEANKLAKQFGKHNSSGFRLVNGILHSLLRRGEKLPDKSNEIQYISVKYSMPEWLVDYFVKNWGTSRSQKIFASLNKNSKNDVRISLLANEKQVVRDLTRAGYDPVESSVACRSYSLKHGGITKTDFFKEGDLTVQDEAATIVVDAFDFKGDEEVLDSCAAPGGKTVQIAEHLTTGHVTALDIHEKKLRLINENAQRMHVLSCVNTKALDARKADEYFSDKQFDKILIDAPCSGLGLLRRKPEIRYTKSEKDIDNLAKIQLAILDHVAVLLKKGGELIYSTCSISLEENEQNVEKFLNSHPEFELKPFKLEKIASKNGMLKILPDTYNSDGFFIAKFTTRG